ncbi:MAG TPA: hypothetical protein VGS23_02710 [Thermoplasmata archaeon]|nr:hypothetical protein [Thermoplasmata archaeon]
MNQGAKALENEEHAPAELAEPGTAPGPTHRTRTVRLGRLRLPIAGPYRPWATAYRLPDGRVVWCLRLWEVDRAVTRCVPTSEVRHFCRINRLGPLEAEVARIAGA